MIKWLFRVPPKVGSRWCLRGNYADPFSRGTYTIEVLDTKEGWVKYKYQYEITVSASIRKFRSLYRELK